MTISPGDKIPSATLARMTDDGLERIDIADHVAGRKVVVFAVPGAFTPTCDAAHLPSFIRTKDAFDKKGVDEIICVSVNDVHVMRLWGEVSGATKAGITMLADTDASFSKAMGRSFTVPAIGFIDRSVRYAMVVEDGVVQSIHEEAERGVCNLTAGETLLEAV